MTDDSDSDGSEESWFSRLARAFSGSPNSLSQLYETLREAHKAQLIDADALEIIEGALDVSGQQVREIMVPRSQMTVISEGKSLSEILEIVVESKHSRYPVVGDSTDAIKGILLAKDLLPLLLHGTENFSLEAMTRPATIIPESKRLNVLLKEFREQRYHMAIVVDEYGGVAGLVTIEDILEEIVGEIEDETDPQEEAQIRKIDSGVYHVAALTPIEEFNEFFDVGLNDEEMDTIGGLVVQNFGHLPGLGENVTVENFDFTVKEGDSRQVKLLEMRIIDTE